MSYLTQGIAGQDCDSGPSNMADVISGIVPEKTFEQTRSDLTLDQFETPNAFEFVEYTCSSHPFATEQLDYSIQHPPSSGIAIDATSLSDLELSHDGFLPNYNCEIGLDDRTHTMTDRVIESSPMNMLPQSAQSINVASETIRSPSTFHGALTPFTASVLAENRPTLENANPAEEFGLPSDLALPLDIGHPVNTMHLPDTGNGEPIKRAPKVDWQKYKPLITRFYHNMPLRKVMKYMEKHHSFFRS